MCGEVAHEGEAETDFIGDMAEFGVRRWVGRWGWGLRLPFRPPCTDSFALTGLLLEEDELDDAPAPAPPTPSAEKWPWHFLVMKERERKSRGRKEEGPQKVFRSGATF